MIRLILVALAIGLYLILTFPVQCYLAAREKKDPDGAHRISLKMVKWIMRLVSRLAGVTYEVRGLENIPGDRAVLYVGNHRSYFDIVMGYITVPGCTGFIAKKEMADIPLLNGWMYRVNCLFLNRKDIKEGLKTILEGIEKVKNGISIWIFPEGTRNTEEDPALLMEFKEGSMKIAEKSGCPVIPVAILGSDDIFERHMPWIRSGKVTIWYGEPIYLKELPPDKKKFPGEYTREIVRSMLEELAGERRS